jgi:V8-like Glu-specific endopeptidase
MIQRPLFLRLCVVLAGLGALSGPQPAIAQEYVDEHSKALDERIDDGKLKDRGGEVFLEREFTSPGTRYLQIYFEEITVPPNSNFKLIMYDRFSSKLLVVPSTRFSEGDSYVTPPLMSDYVKLKVISTAPLTGVSFVIKSQLWQAFGPQPESPTTTWKYISTLTDDQWKSVRGAADAMALVHIGHLGVTCSGFLIEGARVVTNYHCLSKSKRFKATQNLSSPSCADISVEFDYWVKGAAGTVSECQGLDYYSPAPDLAVLVVDPEKIKKSGQARITLSFASGTSTGSVKVRELHFPLGLPAAVSEQCETFAVDGDGTRVEHDCQTRPGSSGSPLLNENMEVVAVHFKGGVPDGWTLQKLYDAEMRGEVFLNKAVTASEVKRVLSP